MTRILMMGKVVIVFDLIYRGLTLCWLSVFDPRLIKFVFIDYK